MKSILIRSFALATLASSISAFAAAPPSGDDPPKQQKASTDCSSADASSSANDAMEPSVLQKLDQLEKAVHLLEVNDKLNQEEEQKKDNQEKKRIRQQNKQWQDSLLGIYG